MTDKKESPLKINKDRLREWSACASGYAWFLERFPYGGMFSEVYRALRDDRRYKDGDWLVDRVLSKLDAGEKVAQLVSITGADKEKIEQQVKECGAATTGSCANAATTGSWANAATTGYQANAATTGSCANAATTGYQANAATTGYQANAATTGYQANAATTGSWANAATTGSCANAATTGSCANAATTGYQANAATTGSCANAATTGSCANAATTGSCANAATTGSCANAATTGYRANAATTGEHSVAAALGIKGKAKAGLGGAIVLCYRKYDGSLVHIRASKVGENGIKPDVWYSLDEHNKFVEWIE